MRKYTLILIFIIIFNSVAFGDSIIKTPDRSVIIDEMVKSFKSLEVTSDFKKPNYDNIDLNASAINIWNYHSVIKNAYLYSLSLTNNDLTLPDCTLIIDTVFKSKEYIMDRAEKSLISNDNNITNLKSALTFFVNGQEYERNNLTNLSELRYYLYSDLVLTLPHIYDLLLFCISDDLWIDSSVREGLILIQGALKDLKDFDTNYNKLPNVIEYTDSKGESIVNTIGKEASNVLYKYQEEFKVLNDTSKNIINEDFARAGTSLEEFNYIHERTAFVQRLDDDTLNKVLDNKGLEISDLTGDSIWKTLVGGEARSTNPNLHNQQHLFIEGSALRFSYLAMFASTSVYVPLHSKIGDIDFMEALYSLVGTENKSEIKDFYNTISQYKKPLFFYTDSLTVKQATKLGKSYQEYDGNSQRLMLRDLINAVQQKQSLVAVTIKGKMVSDNNTWVYYNNEISNIGDKSTIVSSQIEDAENISGTGASYSRAVLEVNHSLGDPDPGTITASLLNNIFEDEYIRKYWDERGEEPVYLDALGNVILGDGIVIIPASANPTYFAVPVADYLSTWWYNPFTVAFYNTYPVLFGSEYSPSIQSKKDSKKWIYSFEDPTPISDFMLLSQDLTNVRNPYDLKGIGVKKDADREKYDQFVTVTYSLSSKQGNRWLESLGWNAFLYPLFSYSNVGDLTNIVTQIKAQVMTGNISTGDKENVFKSAINLYPIRLLPISDGNIQILPYISPSMKSDNFLTDKKEVEDYIPAKRIANNMYMYITDNSQTLTNDINKESPRGNGLLREGFIYSNVICSVLDGMVTPIVYEKSIATENIFTSEVTNQIEKLFLALSRFLVNLCSNLTGYMGIGSPDDSSFLSPIYAFIIKYSSSILFLILIITLMQYIKVKSFSHSLVTLTIISFSVYGFLFVLPKIAPFIIGSLTNVMTNKISANVLLLKGEQYADVFKENSNVNLGSVKLYDLSFKDTYDLREDMNYEKESFMTNSIFLDDNMGVYIKGSEIRLDLNTYFTLNTYYTEFDNSKDINSYQLKSGNHLKSPELLTYYNPILVLEKGLIENLNLMLQYYELPKSVIKYPDGLYKDAFVVNSYVHSYPFLYVLPLVQKELNKSSNINEMRIINTYFPNAGDILRLNWLVETEFTDLKPDIANTIWVQTMNKNGYYDNIYGKERRENLVDYVNKEVYSFIVQITPDIGLVSDENLIRVISLYATMVFNSKISTLNNIVYPRYVAIEEMNISDILTAVVLKSSQRFLFYDVDLVSNVYNEKGALGLFFVDILLICMCFISLSNSVLIPVLYVGILLLVLIVTLLGKSVSNIFSFMFKIMMLLLIIQFGGIIILNLYSLLPYEMNIYYTTFIMVIFIYLTYIYLVHLIKHFRIVNPNSSVEHLRRKKKYFNHIDM